jgi:hypothetical protein
MQLCPGGRDAVLVLATSRVLLLFKFINKGRGRC